MVGHITRAQQAGQLADIAMPGVKCKISLNRMLSVAQLNKLRRQFMAYTKLHPIADQAAIMSTFVQYIAANVGE